MALVGDALGHALLPGIALAFLVVGSKSILPLFLGAVIAGVLYSLVLSFVQRQRRVKPDAAIGLTFTAFFGFGIVLMSYIQSSSTGSQSGLDKFLFGQAAALSADDVKVAFSLLLISIVLMSLFFRQLKALSFDPTFASAIGLNVTTLALWHDGLHYARYCRLGTGGRRGTGIRIIDHTRCRGVPAGQASAHDDHSCGTFRTWFPVSSAPSCPMCFPEYRLVR